MIMKIVNRLPLSKLAKCLNDIEVEVSEIRKQINTEDLLAETASWVEIQAKVEKIISNAFDRAER